MIPDSINFDFYPVAILVGVILAFVMVDFFFKKLNMPKGLATDVEIALTIAAGFGIVSAILFQNLYDFIEDTSSYQWTWAMTFFGGLIGGLAMFFGIYFFYMKKRKPEFIKEFMVIAGAGVPLAHGFGRIGCFLSGCCYGSPTDSPLGLVFTTTHGVKVWPTNLFEAIFLLVLAGLMFFFAFKKKSRFTFPIYMITYGIFRFLIEFLRGDHRGSFIPGISPSQFWSIVIFIAGVAYLIMIITSKELVVEERKEELN